MKQFWVILALSLYFMAALAQAGNTETADDEELEAAGNKPHCGKFMSL